jgi:hypothetical protein
MTSRDRRRLESGSDSRDGGPQPPGVCLFCKKPIVKPRQNSVTINDQRYHTDCWERLEKRRARSGPDLGGPLHGH